MSAKKTSPQTKNPEPSDVEVERLVQQTKEARGRLTGNPFAGRDPRLPPPDLEEDLADKREWKEARNRHPTGHNPPKHRPEPEVIEPPRPPTAEEIYAKQARGLVRREV
jgi:hypothetical protein